MGMRLADLLRLAWDNLWRNRTRSLLTGVGVAIGVAALLTLLAYGSGLEQNAQREFDALKLQNTFRVTSHSIPAMTGSRRPVARVTDSSRSGSERVPLTDSLIAEIEALDGVLAAYPEMQFPAKLRSDTRTLVVTAEGIPMAFQEIASYQPRHGDFFASPAEEAVLISPSMAERLGYQPVEAAVGDTLDLITASLNFYKLRKMSNLFSGGLRTLPMGQRQYPVRVAGVIDESQQPLSGLLRILLPMEFGRGLSKVPFFSTADLLFRHSKTQEGYSAVRIQLTDAADENAVQQALQDMSVYVTSFREQFQRLESLFLVLDVALGIIGTIALLVAVIGIANTVTMNVRERTREIGIMMAIGGDARDLQRLFVVESAALGALGGAIGLAVGGLLVGGLDWGVNLYLDSLGVPPVTVLDTSLVAALAIWTGAVLVSLLAGVVPARRAARIEPAEALRST
jgi:ABC-type antimicrobial peptide transport system permease subunit